MKKFIAYLVVSFALVLLTFSLDGCEYKDYRSKKIPLLPLSISVLDTVTTYFTLYDAEVNGEVTNYLQVKFYDGEINQIVELPYRDVTIITNEALKEPFLIIHYEATRRYNLKDIFNETSGDAKTTYEIITPSKFL